MHSSNRAWTSKLLWETPFLRPATHSLPRPSHISLIRTLPVTQLEQLDARTNLITATRETASAAAAKVKQATNSAMENESVQRGLQSLSTSLQSAG